MIAKNNRLFFDKVCSLRCLVSKLASWSSSDVRNKHDVAEKL